MRKDRVMTVTRNDVNFGEISENEISYPTILGITKDINRKWYCTTEQL
jgi:hypothetical protein